MHKNQKLKKILRIKRIFDLIFVITLLILISPLIIIFALLIKITSPGPIFYTSKRVGLYGTPFNVYKFRTMFYDSDIKEIIPVNSINRDPRITPLGKFLRKTSVDELPAFFNVLKGDMSIVGPRSQFLSIKNFLSKEQQKILFSIKPGITGFSQTKRFDNNLNFKDMVKNDIWYVNNWSLLLDIRIIFKTLFMNINGRGGY